MPLTKEEKLHLATRVRLGEITPVASHHRWDATAVGVEWDRHYAHCVIRVLGVWVATYNGSTTSWEDGSTTQPLPGSRWSDLVLEYLERHA